MELIIFIGLQGAGKSTFFRTHFAATHAYVSKDLLRNNRKPTSRQLELVEEALQAQRSVVIDNTNPKVEDRQLLIQLGHVYGAEVIGYYFESETRQSIERNRQRAGRAQVPDKAIYITARRLMPPASTEGFDRLYYVHIAENSTPEHPRWVIEEIPRQQIEDADV